MSKNEATQTKTYSTGPSEGSDLTFQTESLPAFTVGQAYDFDIQAVGGTPPYQFQLTQGSLPAGIVLTSNGNLSGTPTDAVGTTAFIKLSDSAAGHLTQAFDCQISGTGPSEGSDLTFQTESLPAFTVGQTYDFDIQAVGGTPPYQFQLTQGSLPAGIVLSSNGKLSGTPTDAAGTTAFIKLSDSAAGHLTQAFDCQVS